ncbi:unnamed protein product [Moneuplotes crassus]|uniref:Uncharacterized protein n=1 Tax=Euplotes crassus TaxID=5936 RepID=A0AAD1X273_EUPCR|nr:unnamed protein product [Moneuplotes crassus]
MFPTLKTCAPARIQESRAASKCNTHYGLFSPKNNIKTGFTQTFYGLDFLKSPRNKSVHKLKSITSLEKDHSKVIYRLKKSKKKIERRLLKQAIKAKAKNSAIVIDGYPFYPSMHSKPSDLNFCPFIKIQSCWRGYSTRRTFLPWKRKFLNIVRFLQLKFRRRLRRKINATKRIEQFLKKWIKKQRFNDNGKERKPGERYSRGPTFTTPQRSEKYGSGSYDLSNRYLKSLSKPKSRKLVVFKSQEAAEDLVEEQPIPAQKDIVSQRTSSEGSNLESFKDIKLTPRISRVDPIEEFDIPDFIREIRNRYRILNHENIEERIELEKEDPTVFPIYARLNKLRKLREQNTSEVIKPNSRDRLKMNNDKFDQFLKRMIKENLEMSYPENYEGIYFKTHDEYVKYMKSKYTTKVDTIDLDSMYQKLGATYPRYYRMTSSNLIKSLGVSDTEQKNFTKYKLKHKEQHYQDQEIDLYEYIVESRLKNYEKSIAKEISTFQKNKKERNITWKELTSLKQSVAYFMQTQANRTLDDRKYDIKDYNESDPRLAYDPNEPKFFKEAPQGGLDLIKKLKLATNVLRGITPENPTI